jgi:hypothetical protein
MVEEEARQQISELLAACFMFSSLAYTSILKMEVTFSSEASVDFQQATRFMSQKI